MIQLGVPPTLLYNKTLIKVYQNVLNPLIENVKMSKLFENIFY